ncbi:MAG TPA: acyl dehydratase, partial [Alphaproteobacteria bacterium]|nr:acyl dehydratase [Alphaproteobacteria bacterium]
ACGMGSPGIDEVRWSRPVRPGDTLRVEVEVLDQRPSRSRGDRGTVRMAYRVFNQREEQVLSWVCDNITARRPEPVTV